MNKRRPTKSFASVGRTIDSSAVVRNSANIGQTEFYRLFILTSTLSTKISFSYGQTQQQSPPNAKLRTLGATTQIKLTMRLADKGIRAGNFIIDTIVLIIIMLPTFVIISYYIPSLMEKNSFEFNILFYSIFFCYYFFSELLFGKTLGKLLTKTVVVSKSGNKPSVLSLIFRTLIRMIPIEGLTFLFGSSGLHDLLSKTIVIKRKIKLPTE